ncbi:MAG: glycoside hydrolase family 99-like domain-containing protein [Hespellia sp.]|nr:glycoside hydrolase family 99-like domain-containing protein [Hespellia sp.]
MNKEYEIAAYYFPNYHQEPRNEEWHGLGWNEWELVKNAKPRFEGHMQPKVPLWGYENEADPKVMEKKINAAADYGLSAFIFDWYWHKEGPYLERCLENGYLKAKNNDKLKFAVMWANHDWLEIHPATRYQPYPVRMAGPVAEEVFVKATQHMIEKYFCHPSYWKIDGKLYFSVYELMSLVKGIGGLEKTKMVLDGFRERVRAAGLGELHINAVVWGIETLPTENTLTDPTEIMKYLGIDSVTSYVWVHHIEFTHFPDTPYSDMRNICKTEHERLRREYQMTYFPNVTVGWDSTPRTVQTDVFENVGYPYYPVYTDNSPEEFKKALLDMKVFLDEGNVNPKVGTINAWNEWTEGSYLEPDTIHGMGFLEAIKDVFG